MLNPNSPIPLYHQLADLLTGQIREGHYRAGDAIPPETGLAKQYGIGRPTVRQAMDTLVKRGLVERRRGSGTFVRHPDSRVDLFSLTGTSQAFLTKGIKTRSRIVVPVALKKIENDAANPFNGKTAYRFSRLTLVKEEPVLLEAFCLHPDFFSGFDKIDLEGRSLSEVVQETYYLKPETGRQTFKLAQLSGDTADFLQLEKGSPILEVDRTLEFESAGDAVFSRLYCRTDRFAFSQTIALDPGIHAGKN